MTDKNNISALFCFELLVILGIEKYQPQEGLYSFVLCIQNSKDTYKRFFKVNILINFFCLTHKIMWHLKVISIIKCLLYNSLKIRGVHSFEAVTAEYADFIFAKRKVSLYGPVSCGCKMHSLYLCKRVRLPWVSCGLVICGCRIHWLHLCKKVRLPQWVPCGPVHCSCRIDWLHLCKEVRVPRVSCGPVGCDCRIHWLHLCQVVRLPQWVSWIWH